MPPPELTPDQHSIETPEQMSLQMAVAGIGSRCLALAIDSLIQIGAVLLFLIILGIFTYSGVMTAIGSYSNWLLAAFGVFAFLLFYGYYAIFEIMWSGQTPGKRYVGIRVIKDSGRPLTAGETIGRNLMRIIDQMPFFYAVGIVTALFNSQNKRLGDLLAGSILVREGSLADLKPSFNAPVDVVAAGGGWNTSGLTDADLALIDMFLARRHNLVPDVRHATAARILSRLRERLPEDLNTSGSAEPLLETLAYQLRSSGRS